MNFTEYCAELLPQITLIGKDETIPPHQNIDRVSEDYIFYLVTDGELFVCEEEQVYHLQKGDCFLFEPHKHHFGTIPSEYHLIYIHFRHSRIRDVQIDDPAWREQVRERNKQWLTTAHISEVPDRTVRIPKQVRLQDPLAFSSVCELANKAVACANTRFENYDVLCAGRVNELFVELYRRFASKCFADSDGGTCGFAVINRVIDYLNANYAHKLTGQQIASEMSYHFDYLNQLFRKHLDTSVFRMLENIRIEHAKILLRTTALTLDQISFNVGYENASYFSKVFKKNTGIAPSRYRSRL